MSATIKPEAIVNSSIEKKKLVSSVQTSLGKADSALQPSALTPYRTSDQQDVIDATKVPEAPNDGKQYARKNNAWAEVQSSSGGIPEAPTDGKKYTRQNAAWVEQDKGIADAPSNNTIYGRRDNVWVNFITHRIVTADMNIGAPSNSQIGTIMLLFNNGRDHRVTGTLYYGGTSDTYFNLAANEGAVLYGINYDGVNRWAVMLCDD